MTLKQKEYLVNQFKNILMDEDTECGNEILCTLIAEKCVDVVMDMFNENGNGTMLHDDITARLQEIADCKGAYDLDRLKHASNVIKNSSEIAIKLIYEIKKIKEGGKR